ncbi:acyl-CoA dehydratase activase [Defluviitalea saccharophila]|uniref:Acyl-CoA dehydratase activase n=1 Tax=Defluviitalea saccharophila TaxID=879970 RepID=A0ABZ2Y3W1_9FIRM
MLKSLGLCIGSSSVGYVLLEKDGDCINVLEQNAIPHEGNPRHIIKQIMNSDTLGSFDHITTTGRKFRNMLDASSISEPEAIEQAYRFISKQNPDLKDANVIISAGGETFLVYALDRTGKIVNVHTGNKCASGTGEFFLQQLKRMDINVEDTALQANLNDPYMVAGRCSVFCKSDCTHALNKGIEKSKVVAGLSKMMADKIIELLKRTSYNKVLLVGGTSQNITMIHFLKEKIPHLVVPDYARIFEAFGAALWGLEHDTQPINMDQDWFRRNQSSFSFLPQLKKYEDKVIFKNMPVEEAKPNDRCIVGLDVGSTTTKAIIMREEDNAILASCYLRTNGDPVKASRQCYENLSKQIPCNIEIIGLGVTGSGRQIAALHALTPAVVNEIIAHANGAVYFDPEVDTIFEIGGQDAKYTYITNGVPSDYAMNEACSAGTGSFLEEAARESLYIDTKEIGKIALRSENPPNFNDQCAAFISSDIKSAIQEGIDVKDIAAGLVYSVCMNYINRVKGNRSVGNKIFMQGGVCYNKAVPIAMAALTGKTIIVPPHPGLIGAFGVALNVKEKLRLNLLEPMHFDLDELSRREVVYKEPFVCVGGKEKCDRKCNIQRIQIQNKVYPFGGACNKYYNMRYEQNDHDISQLDLVQFREKLIFEKYSAQRGKRIASYQNKTVGIPRSLLCNTFFPLYYQFFYGLGFDVVCSDEIDKDGIERKAASFCYPVEVSHGAIGNLIKKNPDIYFLPHVKSVEVKNGIPASVTCPFVQGEPYYIKSTFHELSNKIVLSPVLDFAKGYEYIRNTFIKISKQLNVDINHAKTAFELGMQAQKDFYHECKELGKQFLKAIEEDNNRVGFVLFGRPYNAFTQWTNMSIPHKFATRNYHIIPYDFLPLDEEESEENMYWAMGQLILKGARKVQKHPQLFGIYITNFSCGPDSFLTGYFRNIMGRKPSLTLELDSHTADAGIDTRIEAFIDVVKSYRQLEKQNLEEKKKEFRPAILEKRNGAVWVVDSKGDKYSLKDDKVHILIPSMGGIGSELLAATFRHVGIRASALPEPGEEELKIGRGFSSCKECLPLQLTIGSLMRYLRERKEKDEVLVYFMPKTSGPCRFGQYSILIKKLILRLQLENVAVISLTSENGYAGFGMDSLLRAWHSVIISDVLEEIRSAVLVLAKDQRKGMKVFEDVCKMIINSIEKDSWKQLKRILEVCAEKLKSIETKMPNEEAVKIALVGEIYVRQDNFSRKNLVENLAKKNIIVKTAPIAEWIYYCDYIQKYRYNLNSTVKDRLSVYIQGFFKNQYEKIIKQIFSKSGLYEYSVVNVEKIISNVKDLISPTLTGEAILTIGSAITEIVDDVSGVISIGPFGCMPSRIAEAIISEKINEQKLIIAPNRKLIEKVMEKHPALPFLSIETDGSVFPQIIEARLETFCLQVERLHNTVAKIRSETNKVI